MLPDNTVLVTGGLGAVGRVATSEIYTSATGVWSAVGSLNIARNNHTASLLPDGRILVVGGDTDAGPLASAELGFAPPAVAAISPAAGSTLGGTSVSITGTNFVGVTGVKAGGTNVTSFTVVSNTSITAVAPAHAAGAASVVVTTPGGSNAANPLYTFVAPPTVTAISPGSGSTLGGNTVTLTGSGFTGATGVRIGGTVAASFTVVSATSITAVTPAHAAGTASVVVTTPGESNAANTLYTFVAPPTITGITPMSGQHRRWRERDDYRHQLHRTGQRHHRRHGGDRRDGAEHASITATTPAHAAGAASVVVGNLIGSNAANTLFTFTAPPAPPTVTAIAPASGSTVGGTGVTIGGTAATGFTIVSTTSITAITPAHAAGTASVVVTTLGGSNAANTLYTFVTPPTVTALAPVNGPTIGGTNVTLTGTNFTGATAVSIGGVPATSVTVVSATSITATTPARAAGVVDVLVTVSGVTGTGPNLFTYLLTPAPILVSPPGGTTAGGTSVKIYGSNFTGTTGVTFGGTAAASFVVNSDATITATVPVHAAGLVNVAVTRPLATGTGTGLFTYATVSSTTDTDGDGLNDAANSNSPPWASTTSRRSPRWSVPFSPAAPFSPRCRLT